MSGDPTARLFFWRSEICRGSFLTGHDSEKVTAPLNSSSRSHFQHACGCRLTMSSLKCLSPEQTVLPCSLFIFYRASTVFTSSLKNCMSLGHSSCKHHAVQSCAANIVCFPFESLLSQNLKASACCSLAKNSLNFIKWPEINFLQLLHYGEMGKSVDSEKIIPQQLSWLISHFSSKSVKNEMEQREYLKCCSEKTRHFWRLFKF